MMTSSLCLHFCSTSDNIATSLFSIREKGGRQTTYHKNFCSPGNSQCYSTPVALLPHGSPQVSETPICLDRSSLSFCNKPCFLTPGAATLTVRETWPSLWLWNEPATNNGIFTHFCELSELSTFCTLFSNTEYRRTQGRLICIMYPEIQTMHIITGHRPMQALRTLLTK